MKKVGFITLGCKVNIYESNALKNELVNKGFIISDDLNDCDVYIINTCSVTNMADSKSRKMIHKCIKLNPTAVICVMGCYVQTNEEAKNIEGVDILVGNGNKKDVVDQIIKMLNADRKEKYVNILDILETHEYEPLDVTTYDHTRAFVKIEDGCENFCTYCIIPYARGPIRCKKSIDVIEEIKRVVNEGYKEVVLSGIHTGKYKDGDINLSKLVKKIITEVPDLKRLRLSSIEINEIDDEFIELMKNNDVLANHMHLPLQSGSDNVLSKMERRYDKSYFLDKINKIKKARPKISLTTDIIVGFPYETEEDFLETMEFAKLVGFSKLHVFPYSMRKGTKAALMPQIKDDVKKDRTKRLIELSNELEDEYYKKQLGKHFDVIVEQTLTNDLMIGHTSNFLQVHLPLDKSLIKKQVNVVITEYKDKKIYGEVENIIN